MIAPLRLSFVVACSPAHAFDTWTSRATSWWPEEHTVSHEEGIEVIFEPRVGGRIFERTRDGREIDWGRITVWQPPHRLGYTWHIATDPSDATEVAISFIPVIDPSTRIEIEHGGWERLGANGRTWRDVNQGGWNGVVPAYVQSCTATAAPR